MQKYTVDSPVHVHFITDGDIKAALLRAAKKNKTTQTQVMNSLLATGLVRSGYMKVRKPRGTTRS